MIALTRLDGAAITVHAAHIVSVESTPNTLLALHNGNRLLVVEPADEVCRRVLAWCQAACGCSQRPHGSLPVGPSPSSAFDASESSGDSGR